MKIINFIKLTTGARPYWLNPDYLISFTEFVRKEGDKATVVGSYLYVKDEPERITVRETPDVLIELIDKHNRDAVLRVTNNTISGYIDTLMSKYGEYVNLSRK